MGHISYYQLPWEVDLMLGNIVHEFGMTELKLVTTDFSVKLLWSVLRAAGLSSSHWARL